MFFKDLVEYLKGLMFPTLKGVSKEEGTLKKILFIRIVIFFVIGVVTLIAASVLKNNNYFYLLLVLAFVLAQIAIQMNKKIKVIERLIEMKANWGSEIPKQRDWEITQELLGLLKKEEKGFYIDERTWQDLDMNLVFQKIDRTMTFTGEQYLYYLLHKLEFSNEVLQERDRQIDTLIEDEDLRDGLFSALNQIGREGGEGMVPFIWDTLPSSKAIWFFVCLAGLSIISIIFAISNLAYFIYMVFPVTLLNMFFYYQERKRIFKYLGSLFYLGRFLHGVDRFTKLKSKNQEVQNIQRELHDALKRVKKISKMTAVFGLKSDPLAEYLFIIFQAESIAFYKVLQMIKKEREALKKIYLTIGQLDAYLAIASYRVGLPDYSKPQLGDYKLEVEGVYHPLLQSPTSNSLKLEKNGALITGSNMSGKSTMLRAIGINALLSQTIYLSLSTGYRASFYKIMTSIGRSDNVISGDSYYMVEAKALLRIIEELHPTDATLCIVDEIFRGTNSQERIAASTEVIRYLSEENCTIFAATHDLELTELLKDRLHNFHFREIVDNQGLKFDYHLWEGPATTRNAIKLLEYIGYPEPIIIGARETIHKLGKKSEKMTNQLF